MTAALLGWIRFAINDVLFFADRQTTVLGVLVAHGDEQQRTGAPYLFFDMDDGRQAMGVSADTQWLDKLDTATGPHTVAVISRGQEFTTCRVSVCAESRFRHWFLKETPLPKRR
ncbi:hypothetical protein D9M71_495880 [compost metagenome]